MKRIVPILLILCLLLAACGKTPEPTTEATTETTQETTEPIVTEPVVKYRNPLNGTPLEEPWTSRAIAIVMPNDPNALPHHGNSQADFIYELEVEGGITRCMAVFSDYQEIEKIGPVRSARTFFSNISVAYDAPMAHCGGSSYALNGQYDSSGDTIANWEHINEFHNGSYFFRDKDRYNYQGYLWEHCLFTTGEQMKACMIKREYDKVYEGGADYGLTFDEEVDMTAGETANTVYVTFRGDKKTTMTYNAQRELYEATQYGKEYIDGNDNSRVGYRNVLILQAEQWKDSSGYRSFYDLIGSGTGLFACDGKIVAINWNRPHLREPFTYTLEDGTPLTLGVGHTYVGITSTKAVSTYE